MTQDSLQALLGQAGFSLKQTAEQQAWHREQQAREAGLAQRQMAEQEAWHREQW